MKTEEEEEEEEPAEEQGGVASSSAADATIWLESAACLLPGTWCKDGIARR